MITANHSMLEYSNGTLGVIKNLNFSSVDVELLGSRKVVNIKKKTNVISKYSVDPETGEITLEEIGSYTQIPLKIAYAITVHKAQGKTFDEVHLDPYAWDNGQLYVALSRVTSIGELTLTEPIKPSAVKVSEDVLRFYEYEIGEDADVDEVEEKTQEEIKKNFGWISSIVEVCLEEKMTEADLKMRFPHVVGLEEVVERLREIKVIVR